MKKKRFPKDRNDVATVALDRLKRSLEAQNAKHASQVPAFKPQLQFIISNRYYETAALKAMEKAAATAAYLCSTGLGGWSLELFYADIAAVDVVRQAYNDECDTLGLY